MTDRYQDLAHNPIGKFLVKNLGLPNPPYLERYEGGPLVKGTVLTGAATQTPVAKAVTAALKASRIEATGVRADSKRYKGLVFDASSIDSTQGLVSLQEFFSPVLRQLESCGRVVVIGALPDEAASEGAAIAQRALEGFTRSLAKEVGNGSSVNLVYVAQGQRGAPSAPRWSSCSPPSRPTSPARSSASASPTSRTPTPSPTRPSRWPARSPSSPAPRAASAPPRSAPCTATARP